MVSFNDKTDDKSYQIIIQGSITDKLAEIIVDKLNASHPYIKAKTGDVIVKKDFGESEIVLLSTIASGLAATISSFFSLYDKFADWRKRKKWNAEKLIKLLNESLISTGIIDYRVINVSGFQNLTKKLKEPCVVIVNDVNRNNTYIVTIFSNDNVFITEIE